MLIEKESTKSKESEYEKLQCPLHSEKIKSFEIEHFDKLDESDISLKVRCRKCLINPMDSQNTIEISVSNIKTIVELGTYIHSSFKKPLSNLSHIKTQISNHLKAKYMRKVKFASFYSLLTDQNRDFLEENNCQPSIDEKSNNLQQQQENLNKYTKHPQNFEHSYKLSFNQQDQRAIIDLKHVLVQNLKIINKFFKRVGFQVLNNKYFTQICANEASILSEMVQHMIQLKSVKNTEEQTFVLESILQMVKKETSIKDLNQYLTKFIELLRSTDFWSQKVKFTVSKQILQYFCLNIEQTIVVLNNPYLGERKKYQFSGPQNQFKYINDGEFVYKNEYRLNAFCEDKIDLERDEDTMIGSQFFRSNFQFNECIDSGKMIEISQNLSSEKKIRLKLRLNANEIDCISILIIGNSSIETLFKDRKEEFARFDLNIIPDDGDNCHNFELKKFLETPDALFDKTKVIFPTQDQELMVLEDDVISFCLNEQENRVFCLNETRNVQLWDCQIQRKTQEILKEFEVEFNLYVGVVLYSTISEIQVVKQIKREKDK